jgi:hypothetical protein
VSIAIQRAGPAAMKPSGSVVAGSATRWRPRAAGGPARVVVQVVAQQVRARNRVVDRADHTVDAATDLDGGAACPAPESANRHGDASSAVLGVRLFAHLVRRRAGGYGRVSPGPA